MNNGDDKSSISLLLRDPKEVARRCLEEEGLKPLAIASLLALIVGAAVFGGVVGSFRGGEQILYGAIKVPLALLAALVICVPAFHAVAASLGRAWPLRTVVALTMASAGRAALVLMAFAPVLWLAYDLGLGYHTAALAAACAYGVAGLCALGVLVRGLGGGRHRVATALAFVAIFFAASGQTSWVLRPYLVRPTTVEVPFLRPIDGGFGDSLLTSSRSALGIYSRADVSEAVHECDLVAPPPGGWQPGSRCYEVPASDPYRCDTGDCGPDARDMQRPYYPAAPDREPFEGRSDSWDGPPAAGDVGYYEESRSRR